MKVKFVITVFAYVVMVLLVSQSFAETIHLKDGRVINEKIVERGSYYIITMTNKKPSKYLMSQIEYIEEDEAVYTNDYAYIDLSKYEGIVEDKVKLIFNYIDVSGIRSSIEQNIKQTIDRVPEEKKEKYKELFNVSEIIERLIPIYSKYYSKVDLVNMIQFYESPTGQKILTSTPEIMKETVGVSIQYFKEKATP